MGQKELSLQAVLDGLMTRYQERVPDVSRIMEAMRAEGVIGDAAEIENDHIAFRTICAPFLGIQSFEKIFLHYGYQKRDYYFFEKKKLDAYWYAPPSSQYPRIFISELRTKDLPADTQAIIHSYTSEVKADPVDKLNLDDAGVVDEFLHSALWRTPAYADYCALGAISEYASWAIYNRFYLNHFTISIHNFKKGYNTIRDFNAFLERNKFVLNNAGGKFKESPDGLLLQSSTVAKMVEATFADGEKNLIPGSYVEFAERKPLPQFKNLSVKELKREHRRDGFEANNADKIFESTYLEQTDKLFL